MAETQGSRPDEIRPPEPRKRRKGLGSIVLAGAAFVAVAVASSYFLQGVSSQQAARKLEAGQRRSMTPEALRASAPRRTEEPPPESPPVRPADDERARQRAEARRAYREALATPYRQRGRGGRKAAAAASRTGLPAPPNVSELGAVLGELLQANGLAAATAAPPALAVAQPSGAGSTPPGSPVLQAGSQIEAVLGHRVSSQTPGPVRAQITRDVYDSLTGRILLIPQGAKLIGLQERRAELGDQRIEIRWTRLQLPDGTVLGLPDAPAGSRDGTLGARARVRNRWGLRLGATGALALVTAALQLSQPARGGELSAREIAAAEVGLGYGRLGEELARRLLNLEPTLTLDAGQIVRVVLTEDLVFETP